MTQTLKRLGARVWDLATRHAQTVTPDGRVITRVGTHYLTAAPPPVSVRGDSLVPAWCRSGDLTWTEAEALYLLEVSTPWERH